MDAEARSRRTRSRRTARWLAASLLLAGGCAQADVTAHLVPRWWKGNPWGPQAEAARRAGTLPPHAVSPRMVAWEAWGKRNLQEGDILVRMGDARALMGLLKFSKISADMADSRYSHSGIVAWEEGRPFVYDTTTTGARRQPFSVWVMDTSGGLAALRPKPEYRGYIPAAVAACRAVYRDQVPFDPDLKIGDDRLYCIELTEKAYRRAGLPLSDPINLEHLPRFHHYPRINWLVRRATQIREDHPAFVIGNERIGILSSPALVTVYEAPDAEWPRDIPPAPGAAAVAASPQR